MPAMTRARPSKAVLLAVSGLVVLADWTTKAIASVNLDDRSIELGGVMTLRLSHNPGVAFGLGDRLPGPLVIGLTATVTAVLAVAAFRGLLPSPAAAGLLLGGAIANLGDRIVGGSVVDFLDLGWWPSFNLADAALTIGCLVLVVVSWRTPPDASD